MPSVQRGQVRKRPSGRWSARFYDDAGRRRERGGFASRSDAVAWMNGKVEEVAALRRGDPTATRPALTVSELARRYLDQHDVDPVTTERLRSQLRQAELVFGDRLITTL